MKTLLNTLYVTTKDIYLSLDGETVVAKNKDLSVARIPLHTLEGIIIFGYHGVSPALLGACAEKGIGVSFMSMHGRFLARISGVECGNVLLRQEQYRISDCDEKSLLYAKNMITAKIFNARWILERAMRDHAQRIPENTVKEASNHLAEYVKQIQHTDSLESLRGIEGVAAQQYFDVFDYLILRQKESFSFQMRTRRPPLDRVNALMSFAYTLLGNDCANALSSVGLDPYVGFMHTVRPGRKSLALDLMEELRSVLGDRMVFSCINQQIIQKNMFDLKENGAVYLNEIGRKVFLNAWQKKKQEKLKHPFLETQIEWGMVPYVQALLLARTIRGDLEEYPPFFWK